MVYQKENDRAIINTGTITYIFKFDRKKSYYIFKSKKEFGWLLTSYEIYIHYGLEPLSMLKLLGNLSKIKISVIKDKQWKKL